MSAEAGMIERACELLTFAEGFDAAGGGNAELARKARVAARDVLELAGTLEAERSCRVAAQARYEQCLGIIGQASYNQIAGAVAERKTS